MATKFNGYCVYIELLKRYVQIVGVTSSVILGDIAYVSFNEEDGLEPIIYGDQNKLYAIYFDLNDKCIKLKLQPIDPESDECFIFAEENRRVYYNSRELESFSFTKINVKIKKIPKELKTLYYLYELDSVSSEISFITYSDPIDLNIFTNKSLDLNITTVTPNPSETISKINKFSIKINPNVDYLVTSKILDSVIINSAGKVLSKFDYYKTGEQSVVSVYFKNTVTEDCSVFIPDGSITIKTNSGTKDGNVIELEEPIIHFITDYIYAEEVPEPEFPETVVLDGVVYHKTLPTRPLGNYELSKKYYDISSGNYVNNQPSGSYVTYYAWILIPSTEIDHYSTPAANSSSDTTFNGLFKYYKNSNVVNNGRRRVNDTIFINRNSINTLVIKPLLRTSVRYVGANSDVDILFESDYIKVIVTEDIVDANGVSTQTYYDIAYNEEYTIPLGSIRYIKLKIEFFIENSYHLLKTILFYNTPNNLYNKLTTSNTFNLSAYNSLIDVLTGEPAIVKYGCLLLTGHDLIESTTVLDENDLQVTKLVAELVPTTKVRMGNLRGIYNETFGTNLPRGFGLYGESVYLTGNFYLNNGKSLVDISNDVTMAVGNINRILSALENLRNSFLNSIYNLTVSYLEANNALTSSFNLIISNNTDAIFKLGKDYSVWSLGNAGMAIINPNAVYTEEGDVDDSTVGDNDEYILLLGEHIQISTNVIKNDRLKVIVCNINPQGFTYPDTGGNEQLFYPNNSGIKFSIGWIPTEAGNAYETGEKCQVIPDDSQNARDYYRYVALEKTNDKDNTYGFTQEHPLEQRVPGHNVEYNVYSFSISRAISGTNIYKTPNGNNKFSNSENIYYVIPDIVTAGLFQNGKFNADYIDASQINVENVIAVQPLYKNENFNPNEDISPSNSPLAENAPGNAPYVVIQGSKGRFSTKGGDLIIGNSESNHLRITDNTVNPETEEDTNIPAIYVKNAAGNIVTKFSGVGDYTEQSSVEQHFTNTNELILESNSAIEHTFDPILKRKLYVFKDNSVKSVDESDSLSSVVNKFYPGYCTVTINNYGLGGSYKVDNGSEVYFKTNGRPGGNTSIVTINNIKQWVSGNSGQDSTITLYIPSSTKIEITGGGYANRTNVNSNEVTLNHFYGDVLTVNLRSSGDEFHTTNISYEYSGNSNDLFNCDIGSVRYSVDSGNRKFIENLQLFTLLVGESKMVKLNSAKTDITLGFSNSYYYRNNQNDNETTSAPSGTNILPKTFYGRVELITGFRVAWETVTSTKHYMDEMSDYPWTITTTHTVKHYKWLSKEVCFVLRNDDGSITKSMSKSAKLFNSGFTDVTNSENTPIVYNILYVALILVSNNYDIEKTQSASSSLSSPTITPHSLPDDFVPIDESQIGQHQQMSGYFPEDTVYDPDDLNWTSVVDYSYLPVEVISNWTPAIFPTQINFSTSYVKIYNYNVNILDNNLFTLIQGNGFGVGVNKYNYFASNLIGTSLQTKLLSNNFGINLDNSGLSKIFNGNVLKDSFTILLGRIGTPIVAGRSRGHVNNYNKYSFTGTSLNLDPDINSIEEFTCNGSLFKTFEYYSNSNNIINKQYTIRYIQKHDIYLIDYTNKTWSFNNRFGGTTIALEDVDAITIIFGDSWTPIFNKFGSDESQMCINVWPINRKDSEHCVVHEYSFYPTVYCNKLFNNGGSDLILTKSNNSTSHLYVNYYLQVNFNGQIDSYTSRNNIDITEQPINGDFGIQILYTPNI